MRQRGSLFNSLQSHVNKFYDNAPFLRIEGASTINRELTQEQIASNKCLICGNATDATFYMNLCGRELLLCRPHADEAGHRYQNVDPIIWFIRPLRSPAR